MTSLKKKGGNDVTSGRAGHVTDVTSGRAGHVTDVTSGRAGHVTDVTSGRATSGSSTSQLHLKYDLNCPHILLILNLNMF